MFHRGNARAGGTAIGNGSKVWTRGSLVCRAVAYGSVAATLLWALPVHAADEVTSLLGQVKKQLEQSQRQVEQSQRQLEKSQKEIKALKQQVEILTKRVEQTPVLPAPGAVPAPDAKNVVVMQQPGNLPGRSVGPPTTATGVGPPGAPQPVAAAPVSSGGDKIKISLSGQVDRSEVYGDDGISKNFRNVDNNTSSTRFRIVGEGRANPETTLGTNLEMEVRANPSSTTTLVQNAPQAAANVFPTIRQAEVFAAGRDWGGLRLGFGSTASYLTSEFDLSGTFIAQYVVISDEDGGFAFRQKGAALVPGGPGGRLVLSPNGAFGPAVGSVFNSFNGLVRNDRVRYDSPVWEGLQFSTSYVDDGSWDAALRMGRAIGPSGSSQRRPMPMRITAITLRSPIWATPACQRASQTVPALAGSTRTRARQTSLIIPPMGASNSTARSPCCMTAASASRWPGASGIPGTATRSASLYRRTCSTRSSPISIISSISAPPPLASTSRTKMTSSSTATSRAPGALDSCRTSTRQRPNCSSPPSGRRSNAR